MNSLDVAVRFEQRQPHLDFAGSCSHFPLVILGPSGAGKTTLLECVAGILEPQQGHLSWNDETWFDAGSGIQLSPSARRVGYVMQDGALFPHLSVRDNVLYPVRVARLRRSDREARRHRALQRLEALGLAAVADRRPAHISGGERARAALGRALACEPRLLLLDEPFTGLDPTTRRATQRLLRDVLRNQQLPALLVTHDRHDAQAFARWIWVMLDGRIAQSGPPEEVFRRPVSATVAAFVGIENLLPGRVVSRDGGACRVRCGDIDILGQSDSGSSNDVFVGIRPEDIVLLGDASAATSLRNVVPAEVASVEEDGDGLWVECVIAAAHTSVRAHVTRAAVTELQIETGRRCTIGFKATAAHVLPRSS